MNTKIILIIGLLFLSLQGIGQVNPTAAIKPAPGENYILISRDTFGAARFVYDSVKFNISNDTLYFTDSVYVDLSSLGGGKFVDGTDPADAVYTGGNVGIGTTAPTSKLHILGTTATIDGDGNNSYFTIKSGASNKSANMYFGNNASRFSYTLLPTTNDFQIKSLNGGTPVSFYAKYDNGNVGIGTTGPSLPLHILGNNNLQEWDGNNIYAVLGLQSVDNYPALVFKDYTTGNGVGFIRSYNSQYLIIATSGTKDIVLDSGGNVGIGTTSPSAKLEVVGNARITGAIYDSNNEAGTSGQVLSSTGTGTDWINNTNIYSSDGTLTANRTITSTGQSLSYSALDGTDINVTTLADNGNTFALTDAGTGAVSNLSHKPEYLKLTGSPFKIVSDNNDQLWITDTESNSTTKTGSINTNHYNNIEEPFLWSWAQSGSSYNALRFGGGNSAGNAATSIDFYTASNNTTTTGTQRMRIDQSGQVAIGNHTPSELLDVNGNARLNGILKMVPLSTVPSSPATGTVYMDDGTNTGGTPTLRYYNGTSWVNM